MLDDVVVEKIIPEIKVVNPLLERARIPGETFTLPSLGLFYKNGEVSDDVENGEIYIMPMVTLDEIILKSPEKLYSGTAIEEVFKRCIPQINRPMELLAKDVDFILTALRKISFGNTSEIEFIHTCEKAKSHNYTLDMNAFISNTVKMDPTSTTTDYTRTLKNNQILKISPPRFLPALKIYQAALDDTEMNEEELAKDILNSIASMIDAVDEIVDKKMIVEWLAILNPIQITEIKEIIEGIADWGTDFKTTIVCKDCKKEVDVTSEINPISFFFGN